MAEATVSGSFYHNSPFIRHPSRRGQSITPVQPVSTLTHNGESGVLHRKPSSPLLHTRFRASASSASTQRGEDEGNATGQGSHFSWTRDDESIYSNTTASQAYNSTDDLETPGFTYVVNSVEDHLRTLPPLTNRSSPITVPERDRQSWASQDSDSTVQMDASMPSARDTWLSGSEGIDPFSFRQYESPTPTAASVPVVVVSSPTMSTVSSAPHESPGISSRTTASKPSATRYNISNFSRPIRYPLARDEQSKQEVLERNNYPSLSLEKHHQRNQEVSLHGEQYGEQSVKVNDPEGYQYNNALSSAPSPSRSSSPLNTGWEEVRTPAIFRSDVSNTIPSSSSKLVPSGKPRSSSPTAVAVPGSSSQSGTPSNAVPGPSDQPSTPRNDVSGPQNPSIRLPTSPPSPRPVSRASLYSTYSYYQLDDGSRAPSPLSPRIDQPEEPTSAAVSTPPTSTQSHPSPSGPTTPNDFLSLGIQHHEANRLTESAICFERAATIDGGCGVGMLMWGLSLRHAWGTSKDEKAAFRWLRRAAEVAVGDLESARNGVDQKAIKTELVLAIYEVGQCFFHGWGVAQDKKMAVSYFQVAARLGDSEAQQELGYCLANGKGCKKNLKEAAMWYRAAAAQGASTVGLAWIYKSKYM